MPAPASAQRIREAIEPVVTAAGLWLEDVELGREGGQAGRGRDFDEEGHWGSAGAGCRMVAKSRRTGRGRALRPYKS